MSSKQRAHHVLHVTWEFPPLIYGGLGRHVEALTHAQVALGTQVSVLTQHGPGERLPDIDQVNGMTVFRIDPPSPEVPRSPAELVSWTTELDGLLATRGRQLINDYFAELDAPPAINLVHAHDWVVSESSQSIAKHLEVPLVTTFHATEAGRHQGWIHGPISEHIDEVERSLCAASNQVIVCSQSMAEDVATQLNAEVDHVTVIPNGIDLSQWSSEATSAEEAFTVDTTRPIVVFSGRLEWEKGVQTLIDAAGELNREHVDASTGPPQFFVAGMGTLAREFKGRARDASLDDKSFQFLGWISTPELRSLIKNATVAVVPSLYEPFGLTALEAAALGTPIVVSETGGLKDLVDHGKTGLSFEPGNVDELVDRLKQVFDNVPKAQEMAKKLLEELPIKFDWNAISVQTEQVYSRLEKNLP